MSNKQKYDFGDYVIIEQKRHGAPNEMYRYKVIHSLRSNSYVEVPVQSPEKEIIWPDTEDVIGCICEGVNERKVMRFRIKDVHPVPTPSPKDQPEGQKSITVEDIQRAYCAGYINGAGENGSVIDAMADGKLKDAWERYCNSPYMPAEPTPSLQGEIPEEITAAEILHKHMLLGRKNSYLHDAMEEYAQYKCDLLYHKMQEEIKEYRKALGEIQGICGTITKPLHFS